MQEIYPVEEVTPFIFFQIAGEPPTFKQLNKCTSFDLAGEYSLIDPMQKDDNLYFIWGEIFWGETFGG